MNGSQHRMEELDGSVLGLLEHWDETYKRELRDFEARGDPGEVWFGEDSAHRVVAWLCKSQDKNGKVIDIGCGNGYSMVELAREGFSKLTGIDYSVDAIALAKKFAEKQGYPGIEYKLFDVTSEDVSQLGKYAVVHDKGTYDAISLNPDDPRIQRERYINSVVKLMEENGVFVITSCNWTERELVEQLNGKLRLKLVIPTPQFKFGGKIGSVVTTAVFIVHRDSEG